MGFIKSIFLFCILILLCFIYSIRSLLKWGDTSLNREFLQIFKVIADQVIGLDVEVIHPERMNAARPAVLIGNHQTGMDLGIIGRLCTTDTVIIGKRELIYIPFLGLFLKAAGNILINRKKGIEAKTAILNVIQAVKEKKLNVAMMPEGTRNRKNPGELLPFKKGAFHFAIEAQVPLIPVLCSNLNGIAFWEKHQLGGGKVILSVLEPVSTAGKTIADVSALSKEVWSLMDAELKRINLLLEAQGPAAQAPAAHGQSGGDSKVSQE